MDPPIHSRSQTRRTEERFPATDLPVGDQPSSQNGSRSSSAATWSGVVRVDDQQGSRGAIGERTADHNSALLEQRGQIILVPRAVLVEPAGFIGVAIDDGVQIHADIRFERCLW